MMGSDMVTTPRSPITLSCLNCASMCASPRKSLRMVSVAPSVVTIHAEDTYYPKHSSNGVYMITPAEHKALSQIHTYIARPHVYKMFCSPKASDLLAF